VNSCTYMAARGEARYYANRTHAIDIDGQALAHATQLIKSAAR